MSSTVCPVPADYPAEIIGYAYPWIVSPGDDVTIKVSSTAPNYRYKTVRLIQGLDVPHAPEFQVEEIEKAGSGERPGRFQQAQPGSYGVVEGLGLTNNDRGVSISFFIQPFIVQANHSQSIVSLINKDSSEGVSIVINENSHLSIAIGNGDILERVDTNCPFIERQWYKVQISVHGSDLGVLVEPVAYLGQKRGNSFHQQFKVSAPLVLPTPGRLTIAATQPTATTKAQGFLNGRVEAVRLSTFSETPRDGLDILNLDFSLKISTDDIIDISGYGNHGYLVNAPSRAVTGHDWDGSEDDWTKAPYGYGAIHFHEDDLDDARWETDFTITIPQSSPSGAYAVEVRNLPDESVYDYITFFVRPNLQSTKAKIALVLSTFTYTAYANEHMYDETKSSHLAPSGNFDPRPEDEDLKRMKRRSDLGLSLYDVHRDGSGTVFSSTKRPILNVRPGFHHWALDRPREFSADLIMIGFLEKMGIPYDVTTDHDLHLFGVRAVQPYSTILTGSHPEYPSIESYNAYSGFAARGGNILYLGGNGFYWKSMLDPANPHRMEVRRGDQGVRTFGLPGSERHHSVNGARGGLWRSLGRSCNYLFAVGCCGEGVGPGIPYARTKEGRDEKYSWIFKGLRDDELVGEFGFGGGASGDEIDRWDPFHGSSVEAIVVGSSTGHPDEFVLFPEDFGFQQTNITGTNTDMIRSDLVLYKPPGGGSVFSVGSMNWYNSVGWDGYDNSAAKVTENVIRKFLEAE